MSATQELARFVTKTNFEDIPQQAVEIAKVAILDCVGAAVEGSTTPAGKIVVAYCKDAGGMSEASVVGGGFRTFAANAALANATLAHAPEWEATGGGGMVCMPIMGALTIGEKLRLPGRAILTGFILGSELQGKIALGGAGVIRRGFSFGLSSLGVAATAAKMLGLTAEQTAMALALAASYASGILWQAGSYAHFLESGLAARAGIEAAELAKRGFTGREDIIETPLGFWDAYMGGEPFDVGKIMKNMGNPFGIVSPGVSIKKYPCCWRTHTSLDAILELIEQQSLSYDEIAGVEVEVNEYDNSLVSYSEPQSWSQAKFSYRHVLGAAILEKKVKREAFLDENVLSPRFKEARNKVKVTFHPEWPRVRGEAMPLLTVTLRDGRTYSRRFDQPRDPTRAEVIAKYRKCAGYVLSPKQIEDSIKLILDLEKVTDGTQVMDLVRG